MSYSRSPQSVKRSPVSVLNLQSPWIPETEPHRTDHEPNEGTVHDSKAALWSMTNYLKSSLSLTVVRTPSDHLAEPEKRQ